MNTVWASGLLLRWMNGNLRLCTVLIVVSRMKVTREDIKYLCVLPFILVAMLIGFVLMWSFWGVFFLYGGVIWLYEYIQHIDFRFNGYNIRSKK